SLGRDPLDRVGDRRPPRLLLVGRSGARLSRPIGPRWRCHALARSVRARLADAAAPPVVVHRRGRRRRRRPGRSPRRLRRGRKALRNRGSLMNPHPLATSVATAVADRAWDRLGSHLSDEIRLRALLPGGALEEHGRESVLSRFDRWFGNYDTVVL